MADSSPTVRLSVAELDFLLTAQLAVAWAGEGGEEARLGWWRSDLVSEWTNTRIRFASKLLSSAFSAGLVASNRDPRLLIFPRVENAALTYLLYLLRGVDFEGTLTRNPYLASVGLAEGILDRLRGLDWLEFRRQGDLVDFT